MTFAVFLQKKGFYFSKMISSIQFLTTKTSANPLGAFVKHSLLDQEVTPAINDRPVSSLQKIGPPESPLQTLEVPFAQKLDSSMNFCQPFGQHSPFLLIVSWASMREVEGDSFSDSPQPATVQVWREKYWFGRAIGRINSLNSISPLTFK